MAAPPPNPDTRDLPYGWIQQYNWEFKQWFYVNTREQPPRSSWEHPLSQIPPPPGPPPDRSYNRSPYGGPQQAYGGGYQGYQPSYGQPPPQGYYNGPQGGYAGGRGYPQEQVYVEDSQRRKKHGLGGMGGMGTGLLAGGAGLVGGALLMEAFENHDEREREMGFDQGYQDGWDNNQMDGFGGGW